MVHKLRTFVARALAALAIIALCVGAFPSSSRYPAWIPPTIGSVNANLYADFTTEGGTNHYWYLGKQYGGEAAWLTAASGTFTRASSATYTNSSGLLATAATNAIRFDYDPVALTPKGILLEGSSTNLALQSNAFSFSPWTATAFNYTQNFTGPDGVANSGWSFTDTAANSAHQLLQVLSFTSGTTYTLSLFTKYSNHQYVALRQSDGTTSPWATFDLLNGIVTNTGTGVTASITPLANGWFRLTHTWIAGATASGNVILAFANSSSYAGASYAGSGSDVFLGYGAQREAQPFASSYILTTAAAVTRAVDNLVLSPTLSTSAATVFSNFNLSGIPGAGGIFSLNDGTSNNRIDLRSNSASFVSSGGVLQSNVNVSPALTALTNERVGISVAPGSYAAVVNGGSAVTANPTLMPATLNSAELGNIDGSTGNGMYGDLAQFGYWPVAGTAAQLQALTQ
jgi:hypothetical protein